jgi:uncharacterized membrane protein YphA (DoxX/SURF4 family)
MDNKTTSNNLPMKVAVNICRFMLGAAFIFSGVVKAVDPIGTQIKLSDYMYAFNMGDVLSYGTLLIAACTLAGMEFLLGVYMLFGSFVRGTSLLLLIAMVVLTPFTLYLALHNPVEDCGCFGDALLLTNWQTFYKNVFLLLLALFVFLFKKRIVPWVTIGRQWLLSVVSVIVIVMFMVDNVRNLPALDLRPYKVGTSLFDDVLLQMNVDVSDFSLLDEDLNDVTDPILSDTGYTFLLVSEHLESASEGHLDLIDDVYDYCNTYGYKMYGVTASGRGEVSNWIENTGAEYGFLYSDEIPLQTMIRSNPGLVLMKEGVIIEKWSEANIPDEEFLSAPLEKIGLGTPPEADMKSDIIRVILIFLLPLLLVILIDRLKCVINSKILIEK